MRIAVMAAGALGGYFGARMAAAGHDVIFIARGSNLDAIKKNGLKVESVRGDLHLPKPSVTNDPAKVGPVDIVLFTVKLWDSEKAAEQALPLVGPDTGVIPLQNGVDSAERIAPILGADNVVAGSAYIATVLSAPGVVTHTSKFARMLCGRNRRQARCAPQGLQRRRSCGGSTLRCPMRSTENARRSSYFSSDYPARPRRPASRSGPFSQIRTRERSFSA